MASAKYPTASNMIEVDEALHSGDDIGVLMKGDWVEIADYQLPSIFGVTLYTKPVFTYLKYLRSVHLPDGLSTTTSVSKTVGQSDTVSVDASVSETIEGGIGVVEESTEFTLSLGYSHTWESSRTTEDSYTLTGPTSIYFYQPVTVIAYKQASALPAPLLENYPPWATKLVSPTLAYFLASVGHDKTVGLNASVGLLSAQAVCSYLLGEGLASWST